MEYFLYNSVFAIHSFHMQTYRRQTYTFLFHSSPNLTKSLQCVTLHNLAEGSLAITLSGKENYK